VGPINTRSKGRHAEDVACDYLVRNGYAIVERNFACRVGEIDIIARHQGELVFIEVKSSNEGSPINPAYQVGHRKQAKLMKVAEVYLARKFREPPLARFDVVLVRLGTLPEIECIRDAFRAGFTGFEV
jgi:putative endonuclease